MSKWITVATDGSCRATMGAGPMGWAWAADDGRWASNGFWTGTNQRAELWGLLSVLISFPDDKLHLQMDSEYALKTASEWAPRWAAKGWRIKGDRRPVNLDLIRPIYDLVSQRTEPIEWEWVKGHAGHRLNAIADQRATEASALAKSIIEGTEEDNERASLTLFRDSKGRTANPFQNAMMVDVISGNTAPTFAPEPVDNDLFAGIF